MNEYIISNVLHLMFLLIVITNQFLLVLLKQLSLQYFHFFYIYWTTLNWDCFHTRYIMIMFSLCILVIMVLHAQWYFGPHWIEFFFSHTSYLMIVSLCIYFMVDLGWLLWMLSDADGCSTASKQFISYIMCPFCTRPTHQLGFLYW